MLRTRMLIRSSLMLAIAWTAGEAAATTTTYTEWWFPPGDTWVIRSTRPNTDYHWEGHHTNCTWSNILDGTGDVAGGTTNAAGGDTGFLVRLGPGAGVQPFHNAVRAVFANGTVQQLTAPGGRTNGSVEGTIVEFTNDVPSISGLVGYQIAQNDPTLTAITGLEGWLLPGSTVQVTLPEHFQFAGVPVVTPLLAGDLVLGPATLEAGGRTQRRQVMPTRSYQSQSQLPVHFGLGESAAIDSLRVVWPDGAVQHVESPPVDRALVVQRIPGE